MTSKIRHQPYKVALLENWYLVYSSTYTTSTKRLGSSLVAMLEEPRPITVRSQRRPLTVYVVLTGQDMFRLNMMVKV